MTAHNVSGCFFLRSCWVSRIMMCVKMFLKDTTTCHIKRLNCNDGENNLTLKDVREVSITHSFFMYKCPWNIVIIFFSLLRTRKSFYFLRSL